MRTLQQDGFSFDYGGSHILFSKNGEALDFLLNLLGENKVRIKRNTKVLYNGCYVKYPFENGLGDLPKEENYECLISFIETLIAKKTGKISSPANLRDWFYYTFGKGISEKYLIPYNSKIWKYPVEELGLDWVKRIPDPPIEDIVKSSLGMETEGYTHQLYFFYPKVGGIEAIIKSLESKISGNVTKSFEVKGLKKEGENWVVSNGKQESLFPDVICAMPLHALIGAMNVPREVKVAVGDLRYNSIITVLIGLNKKINDYSWVYLPDKQYLPHRISFPSNFSSYVAPPMKSSVVAEITCMAGDSVWQMSDREIIERVIDDLNHVKIFAQEDVCFCGVKRIEYAYVLNDQHYVKNLKTVYAYLAAQEIGLVGRFAQFQYLNMDACVASALDFTRRNY
jgi:protoporphyrinogen oxidase